MSPTEGDAHQHKLKNDHSQNWSNWSDGLKVGILRKTKCENIIIII